MLSGKEILAEWRKAIDSKTPHASIRIGDGENVIMAQDRIYPVVYLKEKLHWTDDPKYCGVTLPNLQARDMLVDAVRKTDFIGIQQADGEFIYPLWEKLVVHYGFNIRDEKNFGAFDNFHLSRDKVFYDTLRDDRILLIGRRAQACKYILEERYGFRKIVGAFNCQDWQELEMARSSMDMLDYDVALIAAGVPAKILCIHAKETGRVGVDFGSGEHRSGP